MAFYFVAYTFIGCCAAAGLWIKKLNREPLILYLPYLVVIVFIWPILIVGRLLVLLAE
jgi:membrane protein insertase Oxa1/YidC/SpoIIIJ